MLGSCFGARAVFAFTSQGSIARQFYHAPFECMLSLIREPECCATQSKSNPNASYAVGRSSEQESQIHNPLATATPVSLPIPGDGANGLNPAVLDALQVGPVFGSATVSTSKHSIGQGEQLVFAARDSECKETSCCYDSPHNSNASTQQQALLMRPNVKISLSL